MCQVMSTASQEEGKMLEMWIDRKIFPSPRFGTHFIDLWASNLVLCGSVGLQSKIKLTFRPKLKLAIDAQARGP